MFHLCYHVGRRGIGAILFRLVRVPFPVPSLFCRVLYFVHLFYSTFFSGQTTTLTNRYLFMPVFLAWLSVKATEHARIYPEVLNLEDVQGVKTFSEFDTHVTLPVFGFPSKEVRLQGKG